MYVLVLEDYVDSLYCYGVGIRLVFFFSLFFRGNVIVSPNHHHRPINGDLWLVSRTDQAAAYIRTYVVRLCFAAMSLQCQNDKGVGVGGGGVGVVGRNQGPLFPASAR